MQGQDLKLYMRIRMLTTSIKQTQEEYNKSSDADKLHLLALLYDLKVALTELNQQVQNTLTELNDLTN